MASIIVLNSTTKKLQAKLTSAVATTQPVFSVFYADNNGVTFVEAGNTGVFNNTTDVDILSAPASTIRRIVKDIIIYNADTAPVEVTIKYDDTGTDTILFKVTINPGKTWQYSEPILSEVDSVNGETGNVILSSDDISDTTQINKWSTAGEKTKLSLINITTTQDLDEMFDKSADTTDDITEGATKKFNVTHTGEVTGATSLTLDKTAISNRTGATIALGDTIIFGDVSDGNNLKKDDVQGIADLILPLTLSTYSTEIDFGTPAPGNKRGLFNVVNAGCTTSKNPIAQLARKAPTGRSLDETECIDLTFKCTANNGSLDIFAESSTGSVSGKYIINYNL